MRKLALILFALPAAGSTLLTAGCEPFDPVDETKLRAQTEAREAFETWVDETLKGNAEANFRGVSSHLKSRWLFDRLREHDSLARDWRARLTGGPRTELDLWLMHNEKNPARVEVLPPAVQQSSSLQELWKDYFKLQFPAIQQQLSRVEVVDVYSDQTGVSILLRNSVGLRELYEMLPEGGTWKINHQKMGPGPLNR